MFEHYSSDEAFVLIFSILLALICWLTWYSQLGMVRRQFRRSGGRGLLAWTPAVCAGILYVVLKLWSAEDVRSDPAYMFFYMIAGAAWVGIFRLQLPLFGIVARDDVLERGNTAAVWPFFGALIGGTCCFAGANVGNGPGWWVVFFSAALSTAALLASWSAVHLFTGLCEKVTVERDPSAALRAAGLLIGIGVILGRAVAGDWVSAGSTVLDFGLKAWPALVLVAAAGTVERSCLPQRGQDGSTTAATGWAPALAYVGAGIGVAVAF
jgi:hypothetical protein